MFDFVLLHKLSFDRANFVPGFACLAAHFLAQRNLICYRRPILDSSGQFLAICNVSEILVNFDASKRPFCEAAEASQSAQTSQTNRPLKNRTHHPTFDVAPLEFVTYSTNMANSTITPDQTQSLEEKVRSWEIEKDRFALLPESNGQELGLVTGAQPEEAGKAPLCHKHIPALDALRGLAILVVTFYRFRYGPEDDSYAGQILAHGLHWGSRGVDLFFVLSGFLITGILYDSKTRDPHFFRNFYARRSLRIFPLYFGSLALFLVAMPLLFAMPSAFDASRVNQFWLWSYCSNIYMSFEGTWCFGALDHFWSLAVEEHFYLIWPFIIFFCTQRQALVAALAIAGLAAVGRVGLSMVMEPAVAVDVATWFRCDALLIGSAFALLLRGNLDRSTYRWIAWGALTLGLLGSMPWLLQPESRLKTIPHTTFAIMFGGVVALAATSAAQSWWHRVWNSRILGMFGRYSYAMYVFQAPMIPLLAPVFSTAILLNYTGSLLAARIVYILSMTAITLALAIISWHVLEKHCLKLKKRFELKHVSR
jgi:peptidoglycan/LPS O-acetylase OafA/YrhL